MERDRGASPRASTVGVMLYLCAGPIIWAAHLTSVYVVHGVSCALGGDPTGEAGVTAAKMAVVALTAAALGLQAAALAAPRALARALRAEGRSPRTARFLRATAGFLGVLSAAGVLWAGGAALLLPVCSALR